MGFFRKQYDDVKGNAKWALLAGPLWTAAVWAATRLLKMIPHIPAWGAYATVLLLSFGFFVWLVRMMRISPQAPASNAPGSATALATISPAKFDTRQFFAAAYRSALTDEAENNMRVAAVAAHPNPDDREAFYLKFIGIGIQSYFYDETWWLIFKSQLLLLRELNHRVLQLDEARAFYDAAAKQYSVEYANAKETFELWLDFLRTRQLVLQDGLKLAITPRGRDFLKYLIHTGRSEATKRL
jgi:hypothetical protein